MCLVSSASINTKMLNTPTLLCSTSANIKVSDSGSPVQSMHEASDLSMSSVVSSCSAPSTSSTDLASASLGAIVSGPQGDRNPEGGLGPMPKQVSDSELRVLQSCLRRWREEVESDVRGEALKKKKKNLGGIIWLRDT